MKKLFYVLLVAASILIAGCDYNPNVSQNERVTKNVLDCDVKVQIVHVEGHTFAVAVGQAYEGVTVSMIEIKETKPAPIEQSTDKKK